MQNNGSFGYYSRILIHTPHAGTLLPLHFDLPKHIVPVKRNAFKRNFIRPYFEQLTDHYTDKLFSCVVQPPYAVRRRGYSEIHQISFPYSRLFCDVERLIDDPLEEKGLGYHYDFQTIACSDYNKMWTRSKRYAWQLYKEHQGKIYSYIDGAQHCSPGVPLLLDCHSFSERDNILCPNAHEFKDIDICLGFNEDKTKPSEELLDAVKTFFTYCGYRVEFNKPFSNSKTIQYCRCKAFKYYYSFMERVGFNPIQYHSLMIEVNKHCYMNEDTLEITAGYYKLHAELQQLYHLLLRA